MDVKAFLLRVRDGDLDRVREYVTREPALVRALGSRDWPESELRHGAALHVAAYAGNAAMETLLVELGAEIDGRNAETRTPLHVALEYNNATTDHLIALGATVDVCAASALGRMGRLRELLDEDPERANDRSTGLSPLGWAAYFGAVEAGEELIGRGARMDDGELSCAAQVGAVEFGRMLLRRGYDLEWRAPDCGETALHAAVGMAHTRDGAPFVRMLLEHGADVAARTRNGHTPLDAARTLRDRQRGRGIDPADGRWHNYDGAVTLLET